MYFRSNYSPGTSYSPGWFGTLFVGNAVSSVNLYNDEEGFCIGVIDTALEGIQILSETEYTELWDTYSANSNPNIWFGDKLASRWEATDNG